MPSNRYVLQSLRAIATFDDVELIADVSVRSYWVLGQDLLVVVCRWHLGLLFDGLNDVEDVVLISSEFRDHPLNIG
jgi:hypothetical protein